MKMGRHGRGSDSSSGSRRNGSVEDDFLSGFYQTRSTNMASSPHRGSGQAGTSVDSSTHEHLHYSIPTSCASSDAPPTADTERWRRKEMVLRQTVASTSSTSTTEGGPDQNTGETQGEMKNGDREPVFVPLKHPSTDASRTPTPPSSLQDQGNPGNGAGEYMICKLGSRQRDSSECSSSTTGGESTVHVKHSNHQSNHSIDDDDDDAEWEQVELDSHTTGRALDFSHVRDNRTRDTIKRLKMAAHSDTVRDSTDLKDDRERTHKDILMTDSVIGATSADSTGLHETETSLDSIHQRSSPLVGTKELHNRRARVSSREHNLFPLSGVAVESPNSSRSDDTAGVVFSPKRFSTLGCSGEDLAADSHADSDRGSTIQPITGVDWVGGVKENGKETGQLHAHLDSQTAGIKPTVLELHDRASSSSRPLSNTPETRFSSNKDSQGVSQVLTNASPPLVSMAPTSPDPSMHFHRPRGYALRNRGMSTPHVVGVQATNDVHEENASNNGTVTGPSHQQFSGSDRENHSLEDWIDGF